MPSQKTVGFTPVARLQKILGKELIADPSVAVIELVKNSYDAGASEVVIKLLTGGREPAEQIMVVADNGTGMDLEGFEKSWMSPGYSEKSTEAGSRVPLPRGVDNEATARAKSRKQTGQKGLGRLAVARLAEQVRVETRPRPSDEWIVVEIDWNLFDTMDKALTDVRMPLTMLPELDGAPFDAGTTLAMLGLTVDWSARIPGRLAPGRSRIRLGRLRQDLAMLLLPLPGQTSAGFHVRIEADDPDLQEFTGGVDPLNRELSGYMFSFEVSPEPGLFKVKRVLERTAAVAETTGKPRRETPSTTRPFSDFGSQFASAPLCGPFSGTIYYQPDLPRSAYGRWNLYERSWARRRRKKLPSKWKPSGSKN